MFKLQLYCCPVYVCDNILHGPPHLAGRPDGTLVRHGQCIGEQLRCDFDAYASEGGASCIRDVPYDDKVGQAATWLVGALAIARGVGGAVVIVRVRPMLNHTGLPRRPV